MPQTSAASPAPAARAADFLESIGINTHIDFTWTSYANTQMVIDSINYLGVKNLRDSANSPSTLGANGTWQQVANATGAEFSAFISSHTTDAMSTRLGMIQQLAGQGIVEYIEGANEADSDFSIIAGSNLNLGAQFQQQVYNLGYQLGIPVINMSFGQGWESSATGNYGTVGDLSAYANYANAHTYFGTGNAPGATIDLVNQAAQLAAHDRPVIATELGWYTTGNSQDPSSVSESVQAKYMLDALLYSYQAGTVKTYLYELLDREQGTHTENNYGLFHADGTPKAAATALHNLTALLADGGTDAASFVTAPLDYSLSGLTSSDHSMLIEKSDGTHWIALWNETRLSASNASVDISVPNHTVTLTLPGNTADFTIYDPLTGTGVVQFTHGARNVEISLPDHPILIRVSNLQEAEEIYVPPPVVYDAADIAVLAPGTETVILNQTKLLSGIAIDNPWAASAGGNVTVNVHVNRGTLQMNDAAGNPVAGSGGQSISLLGSLAEVNARLATLSYQAPALEGSDAVRFDVWNQAGIHATSTIMVADQSPYSRADLTISAPGATSVAIGADKAIAGLSISNPWSDTAAGKVTAIVTAARGTVQATDAAGHAVAGSNTASITLTGSVAEINAKLATLSYHAPTIAGNDTLRVDVWNQAGVYAGKYVPIADTNPYDSRDIGFTTPGNASALVNETKSLGAIAINHPWAEHQPGNVSANISVAKGTLFMTDAAGRAVAGSGTNYINLTGSLTDINAKLATLSYHAPGMAGTDQVRIDVWNQWGVNASKSFAVTDLASLDMRDLSISLPSLGAVAANSDHLVAGLGISNAWAATIPGTMCAIVSADRGLLSLLDAQGHVVAGAGTGSLRLVGSLAEINAKLAVLNYHAAATVGTDQLHVNVWNQAGIYSEKTISITSTVNHNPYDIGVTAHGTATLGLDDTLHMTGLAVVNEWARGQIGELGVVVSTNRGTIAMQDASDRDLAGSGGNWMKLSGTLDQINARLATLDYHGAGSAGTDNLKVEVWNQWGIYASGSTTVKSQDLSGANALVGTAGRDVLSAGAGLDTLKGAAGADIFYFDRGDTGTGANADRILDFSQAQGDKIQLHGFGLSAGDFVGTGTFIGAHSVGFEAKTDGSGAAYTLVRIDTDGDRVSDHELKLDGAHVAMHESDFSFA